MAALDDDAESQALRIASFRHQAALHHEAARFIGNARKWLPAIEPFIATSERKREECDQVAGPIDRPRRITSATGWNCTATSRSTTREMHPDKAAHGAEELQTALQEAAELEGAITSDHTSAAFGSSRRRSRCPMAAGSRDGGAPNRDGSGLRSGARPLRAACRPGLPGVPSRRHVHRGARLTAGQETWIGEPARVPSVRAIQGSPFPRTKRRHPQGHLGVPSSTIGGGVT
jgi:hypothetical protein